jgi:hypothetical protein
LACSSFPGAWALVNRVDVLFGATPNVDFRSFQSDGLLPEVFVELGINKSLGHWRWPFQEGDHKKLRAPLPSTMDVITSLVLGGSVPNVKASASLFERHGACLFWSRDLCWEALGSRACAG